MKLLKTLGVLVLLAGTFASGYVVRATRHSAAATSGRRILYYVDPMHPAYKSDKPGVAPDCGMTLEPVYVECADAHEWPESSLLSRSAATWLPGGQTRTES